MPRHDDPTSADAAAAPSHHPLDQGALRHVLGYQISLADIPSKKLFFRYIGEPLRLRPVEFSLLVLVRSNRDVTQKQLGQALSLSAPNLTLLLDKLEERGVLVRERSELDRRVQHVRLTPAGEDITRRALEASHPMEREWSRVLSDAEKAMLSELLQKIAKPRRG